MCVCVCTGREVLFVHTTVVSEGPHEEGVERCLTVFNRYTPWQGAAWSCGLGGDNDDASKKLLVVGGAHWDDLAERWARTHAHGP